MKTLKVGALALGMMFAGCAMAYPFQASLEKTAKHVFGTVVTMIDRKGVYVDPETSIQQPGDKIVHVYEGGIPLVRILRHQYPYQTALVLTVAAAAAGVIAYRKFTAKKKIQVVEEDEDETEEVTVK